MAPTPYRVSRAITIDAEPEAIQRLITDFHEWVHWSPWEDLDPAMQRLYSGTDRGVGAGYAWSGNKKAGAGLMRITRDEPGEVDIDLTFEQPFPSTNTIEFRLAEATGGTRVEWAINGELSGFMKLFSRIKSMDSMVGPDFDRGLQRLKHLAEQA